MTKCLLFCLASVGPILFCGSVEAAFAAEPVDAAQAQAEIVPNVWIATSLDDQFVVNEIDDTHLTICGPFFGDNSPGDRRPGRKGETVWKFFGYSFSGKLKEGSWVMKISGAQTSRTVVFTRAKKTTIDAMLNRIKVINIGIRQAVAMRHAPPAPLFRPPPQYPFEMKKVGVEGSVVVEFEVNEIGLVVGSRIERSSRPEFEAAVLAAISQWILRPGIRDGYFVRTRMTQNMTFSIDPAEREGAAAAP